MNDRTDAADFPIVDAHQHFWDPGRYYYPWLQDPKPIPFRYGDVKPIVRPYLPPAYLADAGPHRIVKTVHMEAEFDPRDPVEETRWLHDVAARHGLPTACVAQCHLDEDRAPEILAAQAQFPRVRGIRHKPPAAPSPRDARRNAPGSMDDPKWRRGFALLERHGLSFDLQTPWWHLDAAVDLALDFPRTSILINHTGLPVDRSWEGLAAWRTALARVADRPNVFLKISGLGQRGRPWTLTDNGPVVRDAIAIFGASRCLFASNYPVDSLAGDLVTIFSGFRAAVADLEPTEQRALFHDNAVRLYRL